MKRQLCALVLLLAACTAPNPNYAGPGGDGDGGAGSDAGITDDLGPQPDLTPACNAGDRLCLANTGSAACVDGHYVLDRKCPPDSVCAAGYCQAPPMSPATLVGQGCDLGGGPQENNCFSQVDTLSCQPFVSNGGPTDVTWICDKAVGQGLPGSACTQGSDCRSGFCGSNGTCFRTCQTNADCPFQGNTPNRFNCSNVTIVVEGVTVMAKSCIP
jgi:hypothetical protein